MENSKAKPDQQMFRVGVGAVISNSRNRILVLERNDIAGAWQFPQGGLKPSEEPDQAVYREIREETGLKQSHVRLVKRMVQPLAYELPARHRTDKTGRGQVHYWYLFKLTADEKNITLGDKKEFKAWQWWSWDEVLSRVVNFRKQVYKRLRREFSELCAKD